MGFGRFFGGLVLPGGKPAPAAVRRLPLPARLRLPLLQHAGVEASPCVAVGEHVARYQRVGRVPEGSAGADVHAPAAGRVVGFERGPTALPGAPVATHLVIDVDAEGPEARLPPLDPATGEPDALRARLAEAGVAGLGGAGFPSAGKLGGGHALLILNGAECEPVVASDEALLRECAAEVLAGGRMMARLCGATRLVLAMESRMASALPSVRAALDAHAGVELVLLPDRYPAGGERQLVQAIAGLEVPEGQRPGDLGIVVHNVATAVAAWRAVRDGVPLVSRLVTVGGDAVAGAAVFEVAFGTPVSALGEAVGGWAEEAAVLRAGGPMMGVALPDDDVAVGKTTIAVTAWRAPAPAVPGGALPCIRCGDCASACPSRLLPQQLHARLRAGDADGAVAQGLMACIECGACDAACPSAIPLTRGFAMARDAERERRRAALAADAARQRFEQRKVRLQREAEAAARAQETRARAVSGAAAAALAKARAKRAGTGPDAGGAPP